MEGKIRYKMEVEDFRETFKRYINKRIVLYGTGQKTATILQGVYDFNIIGLLDRDDNLIGKRVFGKQVLSKQEVVKQADLIIICTTEGYWRLIYNRIKDLGIPVFYLNGDEAKQEDIIEKKTIYEKSDRIKLEQKIKESDIITFDIFDTLIMRKIFFPGDMFDLVEWKLKHKYGYNIAFAEYRRIAESSLLDPSLDEIYDKMGELLHLSCEQLKKIKQIEIDTDIELIVPRQDVVDIFNQTQKSKIVYIISDMYYSSEIIVNFLKKVGIIIDKHHLLISSEVGCTKKSGDLWEYFKKNIGRDKKILHIGDNWIADINNAEKYNIKGYWLPSAMKQLEASSMQDIISNIKSLSDSLQVGMILSKIFNSPFNINPTINNLEDFGYVLFGGVVYSFLIWLIKNAIKDGVDNLLFLARDGYLMIEEYNYLKKYISDITPNAVYVESSRRAVGTAAVKEEEDIYKIAMEPYIGGIREFLEDRFGIIEDISDGDNFLITDYQSSKEKLQMVLKNYWPLIVSKVKEESDNYRNYLKLLNLNGKLATVDTYRYGSIQYYLGRILNRSLIGYYFCINKEHSNKYYGAQIMKACFQKEGDDSGEKTWLFQKSMITEGFFTSPKGMLQSMNKYGSGVYASKMSNQKNFNVRENMQKGVLKYLKDVLDIQSIGKVSHLICNPAFADTLYGSILESNIIIPKDIKKSFFYDNGLLHRKEYAVWE